MEYDEEEVYLVAKELDCQKIIETASYRLVLNEIDYYYRRTRIIISIEEMCQIVETFLQKRS